MTVVAKGRITIVNLNDGKKGTGIASTGSQYYLSTSATGMTGGSWSTTVPTPASKNSSVWEREVVTYTDGSVRYGTPRCVSSLAASYAQSIVDDALTAVATGQSTNALSGKISSMTSSIAQNAQSIATEASRTDTLNGVVATHTTAICQLPDTIDARIVTQVGSGGIISTAAVASFTMTADGIALFGKSLNLAGATTFVNALNSTAKGYADAVRVGGRNLIRGSKMKAIAAASTDYNYVVIPMTVPFKSNTTYQLSIGSTTVFYGSATVFGCIIYNLTTSKGFFHTDISISSTERRTIIIKTGSESLEGYSLLFYSGVAGQASGIGVNWHELMLEEGTSPSDWTPAPEDTDDAMDGVAYKLGYSGWSAMNNAARLNSTLIDGGYIRTSLIDANAIVTKALVTSVLSASDATIYSLTVSQATISQCTITGCTVSGQLLCGSAIFVSLSATNGVFTNCRISGTLVGVSGSFTELYTGTATNKTSAIKFGTYGEGICFESCDFYMQGGTVDGGVSRYQRFYASDIWCRGSFGARQRNTLVVTGNHATAYTNGLDDTVSSHNVDFQLTVKTDSDGDNYTVIPCYSPTSGASGMPIDTVIITGLVENTYALGLAISQRVMVVNANNDHKVYMIMNGVKKTIAGGAAALIQNIGNNMTPAPATSTIGIYQIFLTYYDNNF